MATGDRTVISKTGDFGITTNLTDQENGDSTTIVATIRDVSNSSVETKTLEVSNADLALSGVRENINKAFASDPYNVGQPYIDYIVSQARKIEVTQQRAVSGSSIAPNDANWTTEKDYLTQEALTGSRAGVPKADMLSFPSPDGVPGSVANTPARGRYITAEDTTTAGLRDQFGTTEKDFTPMAYNNIRNGDSYVLQDTIGGSDLSVFFLSEMPVFDDVIDTALDPSMWRKELIMFELDSVISLSYSTIRERFPVRTLGRANPVALTAGIRTIAGHIAFAVFVEDVLNRLRSQVSESYRRAMAGINDLLEKNTTPDSSYNDQIRSDAQYKQNAMSKKLELYKNAGVLDGIILLDSLPPFNLLVMGVNERGSFSKFIIKGVRIIDENQYQGTAYPNITNKVTFAATDLVPMSKFGSTGSSSLEVNGMTSSANTFSATNILEEVKKDMDLKLSYNTKNNMAV